MNLTWWTPRRICGSILEWGTTPHYENRSDLSAEAETFHVASILGLQPRTTYHFRVGFRDTKAAETKEGEHPIRWSEAHTFVTAENELEPRQLYVATGGSDAHDGLAPKTAWRTLRTAARQAGAGDTVTIAPGRYPGILRPLQTGTGSERRITFRAERPLTVFIDGGNKEGREGLAHCIEVNSKAYLTFENLTMERVSMVDYGSIGGGSAHRVGGQVRCYGGSMIDFNGLLLDCRHGGYNGGLVITRGGLTPGLAKPKYSAKASDCITLAAWDAVTIQSCAAPVIWDHSLTFLSQIATMVVGGPVEGGPKKIFKVRNSVFHDRTAQKRRGGAGMYQGAPLAVEADYNVYFWLPADHANGAAPVYTLHPDPGGKLHPLSDWKVGLASWRDFTGQDLHSTERFQASWQGSGAYLGSGLYPGSERLNWERKNRGTPPVEIDDFVLPLNSPLRGKGEHGSDIGPRWEKWATKSPVTRLETW